MAIRKTAAVEEVDVVEEWIWHEGDRVGTTCVLWREDRVKMRGTTRGRRLGVAECSR